ncbi:MAG: hypothetical protein ACKVQT_12110 [Burkholderiales bacterium]
MQKPKFYEPRVAFSERDRFLKPEHREELALHLPKDLSDADKERVLDHVAEWLCWWDLGIRREAIASTVQRLDAVAEACDKLLRALEKWQLEDGHALDPHLAYLVAGKGGSEFPSFAINGRCGPGRSPQPTYVVKQPDPEELLAPLWDFANASEAAALYAAGKLRPKASKGNQTADYNAKLLVQAVATGYKSAVGQPPPKRAAWFVNFASVVAEKNGLNAGRDLISNALTEFFYPL